MTPKYFSIPVVTKPYLAKYIYSKYGNPVVLDNYSLFGIVMFALLERKVLTHYDLKQAHVAFRSFTASIQCLAPYKRMKSYGVDLSDHHIIQLNRYFDAEFEETLYRFVQKALGPHERYKGYDKAIEDFCKQYGISLVEDTTFECLKKCEYRFRKQQEERLAQASVHENISANSVPSISGIEQIDLFGDIVR